MTDLYAQVANNRPVRMLDSDIILVDIGHGDRAAIAEIVDQVNFWQPRVIGLDIIFPEETPADSLLLSAMHQANVIVLPIGLNETTSGNFEISETSFFYPDNKLIFAASNLPSKYEGTTIREFVTSFPLIDTDSILSFPMAVAKAYDAKSVSDVVGRKNRLETIDYASREFIVMTADDITTDGDILTDKIVLIGALSDGTDLHMTPIDSNMSGLNIHAASIATILKGRYFDPVFRCPPWVPACLLCFLFLLVREFAKTQMKGCVTRILQFVIVYLVVRIGYSMYVDNYRIFDFSYTLLMLMFGLFAIDILMGFEYLSKKSFVWGMRQISKYQSISNNNRK